MNLEMLGLLSGLPTEHLLRELAETPVPGPDSPWEERPLYFLVDYLTARHREFICSDLPALRKLLEASSGGKSATDPRGHLREAFQRFDRVFRASLREEESIHFPGILMNEYALRIGLFGHIRPMASELLTSDHLIENEDRISFALDQWMRSAEGYDRLGAGSGPMWRALAGIRELGRKIRAYVSLVQGRLYPMAARLEMELASVEAPREEGGKTGGG